MIQKLRNDTMLSSRIAHFFTSNRGSTGRPGRTALGGATRIAAGLVVATALAGCDPLGERIADFLHPPSAAEMSARVRDLAARGAVSEALQAGEDWLARHPDLDGRLHLELAALYARHGDPAAAVRHLEQAHAGAATTPAAGAPDPGATGPAPPAPPPPPSSPARPVVGVDGASVVDGPDGTVLRAGDAVVTVPR